MIEFDGVHLSYGGKVVFKGLSFKIEQGGKVVIYGRSGIGKSSLFSLILGFIRPDRGSVRFGGTPIDEKSCWDVRRQVAFVDQDVSIGRGRVADWFKFVLALKANSAVADRGERLEDLMKYFELDHSISKSDIEDLSGGERQRIVIITAILLGRDTFLLDEVTSSLDRNMKEKVARQFCSRSDWTVVIISHDSVWLNNPELKVFDLEAGVWKR